METGLKIVSGRDGKNIDSTDNVKRGQKTIKSEKVRMGATFIPNLLYEGGQKMFIFYLSGVNNFDLALRGVFQIFVTSF